MAEFDFLDLLFAPRRAIGVLVAEPPRRWVWAFVLVGGIVDCLARASNRNLGDHASTTFIVVFSLCAGPVFGFVTVWVFGFLLDVTQFLFKGRASPVALREAVAWSFVPSALRLVLVAAEWLYFGDNLFTSAEIGDEELAMPIVLACGEIFFGLWRVIMLSKMLAELGGYGSAWKGWLHCLAAGACIVVPLVALLLCFMFMR